MKHRISNAFPSSSASEHDGEEQSEGGSDQRSRDGEVVERLDASAGEHITPDVRQSDGPGNDASEVHGLTSAMSRYCHNWP